MILSFHPCFVADAQIILGDRTLDSLDFSLMNRAEAIILPQGCSSALYQACKRSAALLFPNYEWRFKYQGKIGQSRLFERMKWLHPETRRWRSTRTLKAEVDLLLREKPFFIKTDVSHEGTGVWLIRDPGDLESALERLEKWGYRTFLSQEVVACQGNVLRVVVIGRAFHSYWKRPLERDQIITTVARGSRIDKKWRRDLQEKGIFQARSLCERSGINLAAMDFVFGMNDSDPQPLLLEINYYFGRRGLGGSLKYYRHLHRAIREWIEKQGLDPGRVKLV